MVMACFTRLDPIGCTEAIGVPALFAPTTGPCRTRRYKDRGPTFDREIDSRRSCCLHWGPRRKASMIGTTVGHFRVAGHLGRGASGTVYRAVDEILGRDVALKVLNPGQ